MLSDWILMALMGFVLIVATYLGVFVYQMRRSGGLKAYRAELRKKISR